MTVGTASPRHCRIFISSFFKNARFPSDGRPFRSEKSVSAHLKEWGTVIISISSRMLNTRSSLGWIVFWLAN